MRPEHRARCKNVMTGQGQLSEAQADKLIDAGYQTGKRLRLATDEELLALQGIGERALAKVRAWAGGGE